MSKASLKLQQRAELISILSKYRDVCEINNAQLINDVKYINDIEDKTFVCFGPKVIPGHWSCGFCRLHGAQSGNQCYRQK